MTHQGTDPGGKRRAMYILSALCLILSANFGAVAARGQAASDAAAAPPGTSAAPVVDSSAAGPSNPATARPTAPTADASAEASPVSPAPHGIYLPVHTEVNVRLQQGTDSGRAHNGQLLTATLTAPVVTSDGKTLPAGTPVQVTVLATAPAGKLESRGELTLQVTHIGTIAALTDAQTFFGHEGHKDLPDAAPARGTEASVASGMMLKFHVAPAS